MLARLHVLISAAQRIVGDACLADKGKFPRKLSDSGREVALPGEVRQVLVVLQYGTVIACHSEFVFAEFLDDFRVESYCHLDVCKAACDVKSLGLSSPY